MAAKGQEGQGPGQKPRAGSGFGGVYFRGQADLVSRVMGISRVTILIIGLINLPAESP